MGLSSLPLFTAIGGRTPEPSRRFQAESRGPPIEPKRPPLPTRVACGAAANGNARPPTQVQANMPIAATIVPRLRQESFEPLRSAGELLAARLVFSSGLTIFDFVGRPLKQKEKPPPATKMLAFLIGAPADRRHLTARPCRMHRKSSR